MRPYLKQMEPDIPDNIKKMIGNEPYVSDNIGMSSGTVLLFSDRVLKIRELDQEAENEYAMMKWLHGRLPVPDILAFEQTAGKSYLLMSRLNGSMSCDEMYLSHPKRLVELLADALRMLWAVEPVGCPSRINLDKKLEMAQDNIDRGLVDMDNVEPETFGENGFRSPQHLLDWLVHNRPDEELVLSHGDFCLPNVFLRGDRVSGFIDLGRTCMADRYQDIALCCRSLTHNLESRYGRSTYPGLKHDLLFETLGIVPDWNKVNYYILLDELF